MSYSDTTNGMVEIDQKLLVQRIAERDCSRSQLSKATGVHRVTLAKLLDTDQPRTQFKVAAALGMWLMGSEIGLIKQKQPYLMYTETQKSFHATLVNAMHSDEYLSEVGVTGSRGSIRFLSFLRNHFYDDYKDLRISEEEKSVVLSNLVKDGSLKVIDEDDYAVCFRSLKSLENDSRVRAYLEYGVLLNAIVSRKSSPETYLKVISRMDRALSSVEEAADRYHSKPSVSLFRELLECDHAYHLSPADRNDDSYYWLRWSLNTLAEARSYAIQRLKSLQKQGMSLSVEVLDLAHDVDVIVSDLRSNHKAFVAVKGMDDRVAKDNLWASVLKHSQEPLRVISTNAHLFEDEQ